MSWALVLSYKRYLFLSEFFESKVDFGILWRSPSLDDCDFLENCSGIGGYELVRSCSLSMFCYRCIAVVVLMPVRLVRKGLCMAGPPCSLCVSASQSVHMRSYSKPLGDTQWWKVRLSNRIWINFVPRLCFFCTLDFWSIFISIFKIVMCFFHFRVIQCNSRTQMKTCAKVEFLRAIIARDVYICIEQPMSSWAFPSFLQELIVLASLCLGQSVRFRI